MEEANLTRSKSKKGCSHDNSACEGFFGHLKTEMFYGHNGDEYSIEEFIQEINGYMRWYCKDRIKLILGGLSPLDYRRSIGIAVLKNVRMSLLLIKDQLLYYGGL